MSACKCACACVRVSVRARVCACMRAGPDMPCVLWCFVRFIQLAKCTKKLHTEAKGWACVVAGLSAFGTLLPERKKKQH